VVDPLLREDDQVGIVCVCVCVCVCERERDRQRERETERDRERERKRIRVRDVVDPLLRDDDQVRVCACANARVNPLRVSIRRRACTLCVHPMYMRIY
jgi:hypothetical protein